MARKITAILYGLLMLSPLRLLWETVSFNAAAILLAFLKKSHPLTDKLLLIGLLVVTLWFYLLPPSMYQTALYSQARFSWITRLVTWLHAGAGDMTVAVVGYLIRLLPLAAIPAAIPVLLRRRSTAGTE